MVKCFVMCGLPASGKSWQAKKLAEEYDAEIFSSDSFREEMFGDVNHQTDNDTLFKELHKHIRECLVSEKNAVYDACNISYKRRMEFLKSLNKISCEKIAILMATPYEVCLERNAQRERKVPEHVIKRMYMNFQCPYYFEGWNEIKIVYKNFITKPSPYTELALGGGNVLEHPDFYNFLVKCKNLKLICNTTIRQEHFMQNLDVIRKLRDEGLIYGLGISLSNPWQDGFVKAAKEFPNAVIHVINGIVTMQQLEELRYHGLKILILGYKEFRRGEKLYKNVNAKRHIDGFKEDLYNYLPEIVDHGWFNVVSFDNLAIKQLNPQRLMSKEKWDEMYMGDDGVDGEMTSASMYVDMVKREFARNSCAVERYPLMDNIDDMFNFLRNKKAK